MGLTIAKLRNREIQKPVMEMKDKLNMPMDQHRFPYLHTYEDMFSHWYDYDKENPMR
jgi:hypothetical protein